MKRQMTFASLSVAILVCLMLIPAAAAAQVSSSIAGVVRDATGGVLPGVTIEATSPALIEKVRSVVTDGGGQYKIVDLRPGTYTVTFTLPGFSVVKREGIELSTSFSATVNADLKVGTLEETITVSGQSPMVDTRNVVEQKVMSRDIIDSLPTSRNFEGLAQIIPGVTQINNNGGPSGQDVGGSSGERGKLVAHGSRVNDGVWLIDGVSWQHLDAGGSSGSFTINPGEVQEYSYEMSGLSAASPYGGIAVNVIPRDGGNLFQGSVLGQFTNQNMQSSNLDQDLIDRKLPSVNGNELIAEFNPSFGGPVKRDRLWFFSSFRYSVQKTRIAGMYENLTPKAFKYTPDPSKPAIDDTWLTSTSLRLTGQASGKNRLSLYYAFQPNCQCTRSVSATRSPETADRRKQNLNARGQFSWRSTLSNRLLVETSLAVLAVGFWNAPMPGVTPDIISVTESSSGLVYRASPNYSENLQNAANFRGGVSYITGAHAFKVGIDLQKGKRRGQTVINGDMTLSLLDGAARQITVFNTPRRTHQTLNALLGLYVQDQWTLNRLTINAGIRYDSLNASVPAMHLDAGTFVPARDYPAVSDIPNWKDISPRFGMAYDLFGNGKTALKMSVSRYVNGDKVDFTAQNEPSAATVTNATRLWTIDTNGDFIPQESELGPLSNPRFGQTVITTRFDDAIREGWGVRPYNWETTAGIQHELVPGVSVNAAFFHRSFSNFQVTDNLAVGPEDYDTYCLTSPTNPKLPNGGGERICGLYDLKPGRSVDNFVTQASKFGKQGETYDGIDIALSARLPRGVVVSGGLNSGTQAVSGNTTQSSTERCFVVDSPDQRFCDSPIPWRTQVKFLGTIDLPWSLEASGTLQNTPGPMITAAWPVPTATVNQALGRNPTSSVTVQLVQPGTMFSDQRMTQLDFRLARNFQVDRARIKGTFDLYNAMNSNPVLVQNNTFGTSWQQPQFVLPGRIVKVGVQVDF